jgi:hypothetical protein
MLDSAFISDKLMLDSAFISDKLHVHISAFISDKLHVHIYKWQNKYHVLKRPNPCIDLLRRPNPCYALHEAAKCMQPESEVDKAMLALLARACMTAARCLCPLKKNENGMHAQLRILSSFRLYRNKNMTH